MFHGPEDRSEVHLRSFDECGTKATEIRQKFVKLIANSDDATELTKLAVLWSSRFHAPKSHKNAPKVELSSLEEKIQNMMDHMEENVERNIAMLMDGTEKRADVNE